MEEAMKMKLPWAGSDKLGKTVIGIRPII